jgi:hypothetical protein
LLPPTGIALGHLAPESVPNASGLLGDDGDRDRSQATHLNLTRHSAVRHVLLQNARPATLICYERIQSSTVPTRFDIHADSDRKAADTFPRCPFLESTQMKKILMAAAVVLVSGTSLAFAATSGNMTNTDPSSRHCSTPNQHYSLCRQDTHKNGGAEAHGSGLSK